MDCAEGFISGGGGRVTLTGEMDDCTAQSGRPVLVLNLLPLWSDSGARFILEGRILGFVDFAVVPFLCECSCLSLFSECVDMWQRLHPPPGASLESFLLMSVGCGSGPLQGGVSWAVGFLFVFLNKLP